MDRSTLPTRACMTLAAAVSGLVPTAVLAANLGFLGNAPVSQMTEADVEMLYAAAVSALESSPDKARTGWENPDTGASGSLMPLDTFVAATGETCRHLQVINRAGNLRAQNVFRLCKSADGKWSVLED